MKKTITLCILGLGVWGFAALTAVAQPTTNRLVIHADQGRYTISRMIYGHFAEHLGRCIYDGIWVGEDSPIPNTRGIRNDVVEALRRIKVPVLRWPGGCFADEYHWKDGVGPRHERPARINTHWGGVIENNHFGTHEFFDLCEQLGAEPYIAVNVGSGTVQEMMEWIEYITSDSRSAMAEWRRKNGRLAPWRLPYVGIGNESWGCGGNMTPEYYSDLYRQFSTFVKNFSGNRIYKIACGANGADYRWTEVVMQRAGRHLNGISLHHYTIPTGDWGRKGSATRFGEDQYHGALRRALEMETLVRRHGEIMDRYDPEKRVGLIVDEWGVWTDVEPGTNPGFLYQQNSMRDALIAGLTLNIFNRHCDRVRMANIAQTVNVLQAMILTDGEKMILTPTYHVFEMYTVHHDATLLPTDLTCADYTFQGQSIPGLSVSASRNREGVIHVSLCNLHPEQPAELQAELQGARVNRIQGRLLTADSVQAHNTFDRPDRVRPVAFDGAQPTEQGFRVTLPPRSVVVLALQ
jgi:alpha-N-arabinofuranosidase